MKKESTSIVVKYRNPLLVMILLVLSLSVALIAKNGVSTDFMEIFPQQSANLQLNSKYNDLTAAKLTGVVLLEVNDGDIYSVETFDKIDRLTKKICNIEGIHAPTVKSLTNGAAQYVVNNSEGMFSYGITHEGLPQTPQDIKIIRERITVAAMVKGIFVADDEKSVAFMADMRPGANALKLYTDLMGLKAQEENEQYTLHIFGAPAMAGHFAHEMILVAAGFMGSLLVLVFVTFVYFRTIKGVLVPLVAFVSQMIISLGIAALAGYNMHILFIFPVTVMCAVAMVFAVFFTNCFYKSAREYSDTREAVHTARSAMVMPAMCLIVMVAATGAVLAFSYITAIHALGIIVVCASVALYITLLILIPILLSYGRIPGDKTIERIAAEGLCAGMARHFSVRSAALKWTVSMVVLVVIAFGLYCSTRIVAGGSEYGQAFFKTSSDYNRGFALFNKYFLGGNDLSIVVDGGSEGALRNKVALLRMEKVIASLEKTTDTRTILSMPAMIRMTNFILHEGNPRWSIIPYEDRDIATLGGMVMASPDAAEFMSSDWSHALIKVFYPDNDPGKIEQRMQRALKIAEENSDNAITFHAACGYLGMQYEANRTAHKSLLAGAVFSLAAIFIIAIIATRSLSKSALLILPLAFTQSLMMIVMDLCSIPTNVFMIPAGPLVTAIAGGVGLVLLMAKDSQQMRPYILLMSLLMAVFTIPWWFVGLVFTARIAVGVGVMILVGIILLLMIIPETVGRNTVKLRT